MFRKIPRTKKDLTNYEERKQMKALIEKVERQILKVNKLINKFKKKTNIKSIFLTENQTRNRTKIKIKRPFKSHS